MVRAFEGITQEARGVDETVRTLTNHTFRVVIDPLSLVSESKRINEGSLKVGEGSRTMSRKSFPVVRHGFR